ncbi:MAG: hypothetical protein WCL27_14140 [Betaproteobacteria bacterium]
MMISREHGICVGGKRRGAETVLANRRRESNGSVYDSPNGMGSLYSRHKGLSPAVESLSVALFSRQPTGLQRPSIGFFHHETPQGARVYWLSG